MPGLTRIFSTHLAASSAASGLKCMSATSGTSHPALRIPSRMFSRFSAYFLVWAVTRMISHPALASCSISATQASVSRVSEVIIDWIRMGLLPPMPTFPTITSRDDLRW